MVMPSSVDTEVNLRPAATAIGLASSLRPTLSLQAVIGGAVIGGALECLLIVLGAAVGLSVISPGTSGTPSGGAFGIGLGVWWLITIILSMLVAGYAAARLANVPSRFDGLLHGLVVWGVGVLMALWVLMMAAGGLVSGIGSVLGGSVSALGQGLGAVPAAASGAGTRAAAGAGAGGLVQHQAQQLLQPPTQGPANMTPQQAEAAVAQALPELTAGGPRAAEARSRIIAILSARLNISPDEAAKRLDQIEQQAAQAKQGVARAASGAATTAVAVGSGAAWAVFVALAVGAIAGAVGGALARPRRVLRSDRLPVRM